MRWKPPGVDSESDLDSQEYYKWILCSSYPELDAHNDIIEIVGNVTDISKQKWAENVQKRRTDSALESKKHLEHFIDTTSHEMRNPLSAIMQCADGILTSYPGADGDHAIPSPLTYAALLDQTVDAAQTIAECAQHMKRIVDDILTISKLDSGLLIITPIDAQPATVAQHAVKMFESEAKVANVDLSFEVDESYRALDVNWVSLDPTRLLQVISPDIPYEDIIA
jgi:signal transduction histidine kinase